MAEILTKRIDTSGFSLDEYKAYRYDEIDSRSQELIAAGFVYATKTFSLSHNAQINWDNLKNNTSEYIFPKDISTTDSDTYSLASVNLSAFWAEKEMILNGHLDSGRALKKQIFDAVDRSASEAIIDNR